jgi:hypothetical protein
MASAVSMEWWLCSAGSSSTGFAEHVGGIFSGAGVSIFTTTGSTGECCKLWPDSSESFELDALLFTTDSSELDFNSSRSLSSSLKK